MIVHVPDLFIQKWNIKTKCFISEIMEANGIGHIVGIKIDILLAPVRKYIIEPGKLV